MVIAAPPRRSAITIVILTKSHRRLGMIKRISMLGLVPLLLVLVALPAAAQTGPVCDATVPDDGDDLQDALDDAIDGETVCVDGGTFVEDLTITNDDLLLVTENDAVIEGTISVEGSGVTVSGFTIDGGQATGGGEPVVDVSGNGVTIEDNTFDTNWDGSGTQPYEIVVSSEADDAEIKNNVVNKDRQGGHPGIYVEGDGASVEGNELNDGAAIGATLGDGDSLDVTGNTVTGAVDEGIWVVVDAGAPSITLTDNDITGSGKSDVKVVDQSGADLALSQLAYSIDGDTLLGYTSVADAAKAHDDAYEGVFVAEGEYEESETIKLGVPYMHLEAEDGVASRPQITAVSPLNDLSEGTARIDPVIHVAASGVDVQGLSVDHNVQRLGGPGGYTIQIGPGDGDDTSLTRDVETNNGFLVAPALEGVRVEDNVVSRGGQGPDSLATIGVESGYYSNVVISENVVDGGPIISKGSAVAPPAPFEEVDLLDEEVPVGPIAILGNEVGSTADEGIWAMPGPDTAPQPFWRTDAPQPADFAIRAYPLFWIDIEGNEVAGSGDDSLDIKLTRLPDFLNDEPFDPTDPPAEEPDIDFDEEEAAFRLVCEWNDIADALVEGYGDEIPDGVATQDDCPTPPAPTTPDDGEVEVLPDVIDRRGGADRIETAIEVSQQQFPEAGDAEAVFIARNDDYADALASGPLAFAYDAPILLTPTGELREDVANEIDRLGVDTAYMLGGTAAVSAEVETAVAALDAVESTDRFGGTDRFATAVELAEALDETDEAPITTAYLTEGRNPDEFRGWSDAVAVSGLAAAQGRPILLSDDDALPEPTEAGITDLGLDETVLIGGSAALSAGVEASVGALVDTDRIAGEDRYATSVAVAERSLAEGFGPEPTWIATGLNWPDTVVGGPAVARSEGVLVLIDGEDPTRSQGVLDWFAGTAEDRTTLFVVGGEAAITQGVIDAIGELDAEE